MCGAGRAVKCVYDSISIIITTHTHTARLSVSLVKEKNHLILIASTPKKVSDEVLSWKAAKHIGSQFTLSQTFNAVHNESFHCCQQL